MLLDTLYPIIAAVTLGIDEPAPKKYLLCQLSFVTNAVSDGMPLFAATAESSDPSIYGPLL